MKTALFTKPINELKTEALVIGCYLDTLDDLDNYGTISNGLIQEVVSDKEFIGKLNQIVNLRLTGNVKRILLLGLGKRDEFNVKKAREATGKAVLCLRDQKVKEFSFCLFNDLQPYDSAFAIVEGIKLALYQFNDFKTQELDEINNIKAFTIVADQTNILDVDKAIREALIISDAVYLARDLTNNPGNIATPEMLARKAIEISKKNDIKCVILENKDMKKLGMGGILAVNKGSDKPAKFIILDYNGGKKTICLIGKGITFDAGGISLKPSAKMDEMKSDMAGGATVIGVIEAAARLKLPYRIIGLIPSTENVPGTGAYKPGDIIKISNGKTIEIVDTDAEGRLVLADALAYADRFKPLVIIDLATLTGACVIALGGVCSGLFSNDETLSNNLIEAGEKTNERLWRFPLFDEYKEDLKSSFADMKNFGGREAGAITAAVFLKEQVGKNKWAHLDIAGTAWVTKACSPLTPIGGTGVGVRLLIEMLRNWKD